MNKLLWCYQVIETTLASLKFAVFIISVFALFLAVGTFAESSGGADYANRLIYKSPWFMATQALMFLSVLMATLKRLPFQKRLRGFYLLHLGILLLFTGSFITYQKGIDGSLVLYPNEPENRVRLNRDQIEIWSQEKQKKWTLPLPYSAFASNLNQTIHDLTFMQYLPFAEKKVVWQVSKEKDEFASAIYQIENEMVSEQIYFSLHPQSDFQSSLSLGPLNIHYLPAQMKNCFQQAQDFILWDAQKQNCVPSHLLQKKQVVAGQEIYIYQNYAFIPTLSPMPVVVGEDDELQPMEEAAVRLFNRKLFQKEPHLFLFGKSISFYDSEKEQWQYRTQEGENIELPWMNFRLQLLRQEQALYPSYQAQVQRPVQDNNELVMGAERAVLIRQIAGAKQKEFWLYKNQPLQIQSSIGDLEIAIRSQSIHLDFQVTLEKFNQDFDPGTENPASYESFVKVFDGQQSAQHHIYMNHPLYWQGLTFYQASYFPLENQQYGSVLTVNYDPGRTLKYIGSLFLIFGTAWHFIIRRRQQRSLT